MILTRWQAVDENLFAADKKITSALKILPDTIEEARRIAAKSDFIKETLGEEILKAFLD